MVVEKGLAYAKDVVKKNGVILWNKSCFYDYKIIDENNTKSIQIKKENGTYAIWNYTRKILVQQVFIMMKDMELE